MTPRQQYREWRDKAGILEAYKARGLLDFGPAWRFLPNGRKVMGRTHKALEMAQAAARYFEAIGYGDPRDAGYWNWDQWENEPTQRAVDGDKDDWTLEGARERVRRCDEQIAADPDNPVWRHLRGIARTAEQRKMGEA